MIWIPATSHCENKNHNNNIPGNGTCYSVGVLSRIERAVSCKDHIEGSIIGPRARSPISTHLQTSVTLSARRWENIFSFGEYNLF